MTKEELAAQLDGNEYGSEIPTATWRGAKAAGLVIVYGASDDLMEMEGAISDEGGCYDGGTFKIDARGILPDWADVKDDEDTAADYLVRKGNAKEITANWDTDGYSWTYTTDIPHATFDILEDGEKYCRGIVFSVKDL